MGTPRLARSLVTFRAQLDAAFPGRSTKSDGWIGDAAHAARGNAWTSQHNPNDDDVVCALDVTEDLAAGLDCQRLMDELDASNDPRIYYLIHDWRIDNSDDTRTVYGGPNGHVVHLHLSERPDRPDLYDDPRPWDLPMLRPHPAPATRTPEQIEEEELMSAVAEFTAAVKDLGAKLDATLASQASTGKPIFTVQPPEGSGIWCLLPGEMYFHAGAQTVTQWEREGAARLFIPAQIHAEMMARYGAKP